MKDEGWLVKVYEYLDKDNMITIEKPEDHDMVNYCEIKYKTIKTLPDDGDLEFYDKNADMLSCVLNEYPVSDISKIAAKLKIENDLHSQVGGYPHWLQGNENGS